MELFTFLGVLLFIIIIIIMSYKIPDAKLILIYLKDFGHGCCFLHKITVWYLWRSDA